MLQLLADESLHGDIIKGLRLRQNELDIVRAQEVGLRTADDTMVLEWAAAHGRILVSPDRKTMTNLAWTRVASGLEMPGVFALRPEVTVRQAIDAIHLAANCSEPEEWKDRVVFLPL